MRGSSGGVGDHVLDYDVELNKLRLHSHNNVYFQTITLGKHMNPFILLTFRQIIPLLIVYKDDFRI